MRKVAEYNKESATIVKFYLQELLYANENDMSEIPNSSQQKKLQQI